VGLGEVGGDGSDAAAADIGRRADTEVASLSEQQLNDMGLNFLRTQLVTVPGAVVPFPYGGKQRQVMVNLVPQLHRVRV
jgi:hypothetical protein